MIPRIVIVDDEAPARTRLVTLLSDIAGECPHELVGQAGNAQAALDTITSAKPDVVLLDIQMPGMNGIELAAHLVRHVEPPPAIIFITAYDTFALKAFEVHAVDYLLKPVRAAKLAEAIGRAAIVQAGRIAQSATQSTAQSAAQMAAQMAALGASAGALGLQRANFSIQERGRVLLVPVQDVVYLRAELKYVTLRTKAREYITEESLLSLEQEMGERFVRVHRNTLVARHAIAGVERGQLDLSDPDKAQESWQIILRDIDERLPISRRQWPVIKALLNRGV
ncbi:MAG TPA: LytTR family DNA-binding domain-containing protein [Burkholderiaceae bacterium]|jgi:two-component system response regulator AlgR